MIDLTVITQNSYVFAATILIVFFILAKIAHYIIKTYIMRLAKKTKTEVDDLIIERTNKPISFLLFMIGVYIALTPLRDEVAFSGTLDSVISSIGILIVTYIISSVIDILISTWGKTFAKKTASDLDDQLLDMVHRFSRIVIFAIGIMFVLPVWGIQIGPLLASLGIAGIAIAFALQATLSNIFGGASLIIDKAYKVGDVIELDAGTMGTVMEVGLRSTRIRTWDNEIIVVPNGNIANAKLTNFHQPSSMVRGVIVFGVEYGSDTQRTKEVALEVAKKHEKILEDPEPACVMLTMNNSSLDFRLTFWVGAFEDRFMTKCDVTEKLYNALQDEGIGVPFPTRTVYMKKEE